MTDFGFTPMSLTMKRLRSSPKFFFAALVREIKVVAITWILDGQINWEPTGKRPNRLHNSEWKRMAEAHLPFGRFKNMDDLMRYSTELTEHTINTWSLDKIESKWNTRLNYIHNWMETSHV